MTKSQIISGVALAAGVVLSVATKLLPVADVLPPVIAKRLPVTIAIATALVTAFQQSLNTNHVSIPADEAQAIARRLPDAPASLLKQVEKLEGWGMGEKGATKKPFWAKARREYVCWNCEGLIEEGADVLIFQPVTIDHERGPWQFACGECGDWEIPRVEKETTNVSQSQVQGVSV